MHLYHLTVIPPGGATCIAYGSFSAARQQEVVLASGSSLQLYRLTKSGQLVSVARGEAFAAVQAVVPFRLTGSRQDYLLVTSDSGALALLTYSSTSRSFVRLRFEVYGRTGCRRVVPGHFLAADPKGRACMVAAIERSKFAYILTRDSSELISIQSPLEAHKPDVSTHSLVALDVAFENPMFAALEQPYETSTSAAKLLVYYELDLGLNNVVRRSASPVHPASNALLAVPGGTDGPGGVLVCSPGRLTYRNLVDEEEEEETRMRDDGDADKQSNLKLEALLPYRASHAKDAKETLIVSGTMHRHKDVFFFVLCSEHGDLLKVELDWTEDDGATEMRIFYFDTLPAPVHALAIFRSGYLLAALETGNPYFLKFSATAVAPEDMETGFSSSNHFLPQSNGPADGTNLKSIADENLQNGEHLSSATTQGVSEAAPNARTLTSLTMSSDHNTTGSALEEIASRRQRRFKPRGSLKYFSVADILESFACSTAISCGDFCREGIQQLVCAGGRGQQSVIRVLRRGLAVLELLSQTMSRRITACFTLREKAEDSFERYIIVSFDDATKVLRVSDETVSEVSDTGFSTEAATIFAAQMGDTSLVQAQAGTVRFFDSAAPQNVTVWNPPNDSRVLAAAGNTSQLLVALSTGDVIYFEVEQNSQSLNKVTTINGAISAVSNGEVVSQAAPTLALPDCTKSKHKTNLVAVSDGQSSIVRIYMLDDENEFRSVGVHMAPATVESLSFVDFGDLQGEALSQAEALTSPKSAVPFLGLSTMMYIIVGTRRGVLVWLSVDPSTGALSDKRSKYLGRMRVRTQKLSIAGVPMCVSMCSKPWLIHRLGSRLVVSPLCTEYMDSVNSFSSEQYPDGLVAISGSVMRFISLESLDALCASAGLPQKIPTSLIPNDVNVGSTFFMAKSQLDCTPRCLLPIPSRSIGGDFEHSTAPEGISQGAHAIVAGSGQAASEDGLFLVLESQHRAKFSSQSEASVSSEKSRVDVTDTERSAVISFEGVARDGLQEADLGCWASQIRLVSIRLTDNEEEDEGAGDVDGEIPANDFDDEVMDAYAKAAKTVDVVRLVDERDCALCCACFAKSVDNLDQDVLVVVSIAKNLAPSATTGRHQRCQRAETNGSDDANEPKGELRVYRINKSVGKLSLVHVTLIEQPAYAIAAFRGMMMVGMGTALRIYAMGKRRLLRKAEARSLVRKTITAIAVVGGDRAFVGDVQDSVKLVQVSYSSQMSSEQFSGPQVDSARADARSNLTDEIIQIRVLARDDVPKSIVAIVPLDYSTVCCSDKFGNLHVLRLPSELAGVIDRALQSSSQAAGEVPYRLSSEARFHLGSIVTSLARGSLCGGSEAGASSENSGESESIIYCTMGGSIGTLSPLKLASDVDLAVRLEKFMRERDTSIVGRFHVSYRSSFAPVKRVVDGDLCEQFVSLPHEEQAAAADSLGRSLEDVLRKLDEFRQLAL